MNIKIKYARKIKSLLLKYQLQNVLNPISGALLNLIYLSKLSKYLQSIEKPEFNDFYSPNRDYNKRYKLYEHIIKSENLDKIYYLEFGVAKGKSIKWWTQNVKSPESKFVGFDTFTGLPENWGEFNSGDMSSEDEFPEINDKRCQFKKGLFQETLPVFLKNFDTDCRKIIHMDADLYSSTLYVLTSLASYLQKDDIIIFDEFNVPLHEFKAFHEFINSYYVEVKMIGAVNNYYQAAFRIT